MIIINSKNKVIIMIMNWGVHLGGAWMGLGRFWSTPQPLGPGGRVPTRLTPSSTPVKRGVGGSTRGYPISTPANIR